MSAGEARPRWLVVDSRKVNVGEYKRLAPNVVVLGVVLLIKLLRLRMKFPQAVPYDARFTHVDDAALPGWARRALDRLSAAAAELELRFAYTLDVLGTTSSFARVYVDDTRTIMMQLMTSRTMPLERNREPEVRSFVVVTTPLTTTARWLATTNNTTGFDPPSAFDGEIVHGDAAATLARHGERLAHATHEGLVMPLTDGDEALDREIAQHHNVAVAHLIARGVYIDATDEELDELERKATAARSLDRD